MDLSPQVDNTCVVCFKPVSIYSIGCCDHHVCFECSTRMRVLCRQNECPICRQDIQLVVFTSNIKPFAELKNKMKLIEQKYNIAFATTEIQDAFYKLLEHACTICRHRTFRNFKDLEQHMRRSHDLHYCDLCVTHLKILTSERRYYSKVELSQHRRQGDVDDKSHKGHPLCQFCDTRYMDNDELYRHLRRDHLFCHICDADGLHMYYSSYDFLRDHFRDEHFLCEEGRCIDEKFTPVFRSEIDLRAHRALEHGRSLGKMAAKQARTLEVEFTLKPRPRTQDPRRRGRPESDLTERDLEPEPRREPTPPLNPSDFPTLGNGNAAPIATPAPHRASSAYTIRAVGRNGPQYEQNFPGLPGGSSHPSTSVRLNINSDRKPGSSNNSQSNLSIHVNHRPARKEAFPALASNSSGLNWVAVSKTLGNPSQQPKPPSEWTVMSKKTPAPAPAAASTVKKTHEDDFPTLNSKFSANLNLNTEPLQANYVNLTKSKNQKKASSVTIPVEKSWPAPESPQPKGKTRKKKKGGSEDTVKKKPEKSPEKSPDKVVPKENKSALNQEALSKPLPTAADWFGSSKRKESEKKEVPDTEIDSMVESVLQFSRNLSNKIPKPPPGFTPLNGFIAPPPGFERQPASNGLTFTNSSGEMFPIRPAAPYLPPVDFDERNINLLTKVNDLLLNGVDEFRLKSAAFRCGEMSAENYYQHCLKTMGDAWTTEVLPELLVLLPDINKQRELWDILKKNNVATSGKIKLDSCSICRQVVPVLEMKHHLASHVVQFNNSS